MKKQKDIAAHANRLVLYGSRELPQPSLRPIEVVARVGSLTTHPNMRGWAQRWS
jgi:hypothetical protein